MSLEDLTCMLSRNVGIESPLLPPRNVPEELISHLRSSVGISGTCQLLLVIGIEQTGTAVLECIVNCL